MRGCWKCCERREYLTTLLEGITNLHEHELVGIRLSTEMEVASVSAEQATALGLIVNEFVTNSLKYVFDGSSGEIRITAETTDGDRLRLCLHDTGKGLADPAHPAGTGTGMQIIAGLCGQLGAQPDWLSASGTTLTFEFQIS